MFTKQYEQILAYSLAGLPEGTTTFYNASGSPVTANSADMGVDYLKLRPLRYAFQLKTGGSSAGYISFWQGASTPSKDAVKPDGTEVTSFSATVVYKSEAVENGVNLTRLYTLTNTASSPITIDTVCLCAEFSWKYSGGNMVFLCDKTQLETPVTIPAGGVGQITYTIHIDYPTA